MEKAVLQALNTLLPTISGPIPEKLSNHALDLLVASRSKVPSLKAEEELARAYVCANLACERYKQILNLPRIQVRPPIAPRAYNKLYTYFETSLPVSTRGTRARSAAGTPVKDASTPARSAKASASAKVSTPVNTAALSTPTKLSSSAAFTPVSQQDVASTPRDRLPLPQPQFTKRLQAAPEVVPLPSWVRPTIYKLCTALSARSAPGHVLAGVTSTWTSLSPPISRVPSLIIAVFFFVCMRLSGTQVTAEQYLERRRAAVKAWRGIGTEFTVAGTEIDAWLQELGAMEKEQIEWLRNVPEGAGVDGTPLGGSDIEDTDEVEESKVISMTPRKPVTGRGHKKQADERETVLPGLGTMMCDRVDYLSDVQQKKYDEWLEVTIPRIVELENAMVE